MQFVVIDLGPATHSDSTGAYMLKQLTEELGKQNIQLVLANPSHTVVRLFERVHLFDVLPKKWVFVHVYDAVKAATTAMAAESFGELGGCAVVQAPHRQVTVLGRDDVHREHDAVSARHG